MGYTIDDARRDMYEEDYYEHMADLHRQQWLEEELTQQSQDTIKNAIENAYGDIQDELSVRVQEIEFLKTSRYFNLLSISCLLTIEKLSRELVALPVLSSILSSNSKHVHRGDYLLEFLDREVRPVDFLYDVFQTANDATKAEQAAVQIIVSALGSLGVDGFFIKASGSTGHTKITTWMDSFRRFRNQLMHGRMTATEGQSRFTLSYFDAWLSIVDHALSKYDLSITKDLRVVRRKGQV